MKDQAQPLLQRAGIGDQGSGAPGTKDQGPGTTPQPVVTVRTRIKPGDIGSVVRFHGVTYAREYGFDHTFEAYVAEPLGAFAKSAAPKKRLWIAEQGDRLVGCIAIVAHSTDVAQLRWFLVDADCRGAGLGRRLLNKAVAFCRASGYRSVILWTVSALTAAARLYVSAGFRKVEDKPGTHWGVHVVEERYELDLRSTPA